MIKHLFFSAAVVLYLGLPVFSAQQDASSDLGEVQIKGEAKDKVKIKKFIPEIKIYVPDIVDSVTETTEKLLNEGREVPSVDDYKTVKYQVSGQAAKPFLTDIAESPLVSFYPEMAEVPVTKWELVINDDKGNIVETKKGKGNPVRSIQWDGRDSKGKMIKVDSLYSYKFIVYDNLNNPHTSFGRSFKVDAVIFKDKGKTIIEFSNKYLFNADSSGFNSDSNLALEKAVDVLRAYSKYPFTIEFYDKDPLSLLVKERQKKLVQYTAKEMLLMEELVRHNIKRIDDRGNITRFVIHK